MFESCSIVDIDTVNARYYAFLSIWYQYVSHNIILLIVRNNLKHLSSLSKQCYSESITKEDEEVHRMIRDCLDLRKKYLYRENVVPWRVARPDSSEKKSNPYHFEPVKASAVSHSLLIKIYQICWNLSFQVTCFLY